jgi:8-oxo-dGTP pyrophosphatase MutT (NUDIX family)
LSETLHATCRVFNVYKKRCKHDGRTCEDDFFVIKSADWVQVLALTPEREIILVRQYRFGTEALSLEVPAGLVEPGESVLDAAQRELLEETGYKGSMPRLLGSCHPNPAILNNQAHMVLIENCHLAQPPQWDPHEEIEVVKLSPEEALKRAREGEISHAITLSALFYLEAVL